jgi:hypothetical protein
LQRGLSAGEVVDLAERPTFGEWVWTVAPLFNSLAGLIAC